MDPRSQSVGDFQDPNDQHRRSLQSDWLCNGVMQSKKRSAGWVTWVGGVYGEWEGFMVSGRGLGWVGGVYGEWEGFMVSGIVRIL